jgi:hypothetical protein
MFTKVTLGLAAIALTCLPVLAQSPAPIVVQAIMPATAATTAPAPNVAAAATSEAALNTLLAIKAANEEILRKQAATLLQLEEMEKAADQIKIYSKRG